METYAPVGELGWLNATYTSPLAVGPPTCPPDLAKPLATSGQLFIGDVGAITFTLAEGARCVGVESAWNEPQELTITGGGGPGPFADASGAGAVVRGFDDVGGFSAEYWAGKLEAPGLGLAPPGPVFDLTPPMLSGAVARTVRVAKNGAKSARVTFEVTAIDDLDGSVPVSCRPKSGSRFKVGTTRVRCEASDWSGNTSRATFTVTVKQRR